MGLSLSQKRRHPQAGRVQQRCFWKPLGYTPAKEGKVKDRLMPFRKMLFLRPGPRERGKIARLLSGPSAGEGQHGWEKR